MRRMIAAAGLSAGLVLSGCAENRELGQEQPVQTTVASAEPSRDVLQDAWTGALEDLRAKVSRAEAFRLLVAEDVCIAWDNMGPDGITLIKNPVMYSKKGDDHTSLAFLPFVNTDGSVMNGPYSYSKDTDGGYSVGNMGAIQVPNTAILFDGLPDASYKAVADGHSGWLEGPDGAHYAETHYVSEADLQPTLEQLCPGQELTPLSPETEVHKD